MATVKTAISLNERLLEQADALAGEMHISRSRLFALAIEEYLHRHQNEALLEALNAAYGEPADADEQAYTQARARYHLRLVKDEW
jgi:metal-responsive CopG/Arc/MetJ family transcriptional regulator